MDILIYSILNNKIKQVEENMNGLCLVVLTQEEYDNLEVKDSDTLYFIKKE